MREELMQKLRAEAHGAYAWSNESGYRYDVHEHAFTKVLYCVAGSIDFHLTDEGRTLRLKPGDRMELPPGTRRSADVGPQGVTCIEGKKRDA